VATAYSVTIWGDTEFNQRNDAPTDAGFVAIACGKLHSVALRGDGTVCAWGGNRRGMAGGHRETPISDGFVAVACGALHTVALRKDGHPVRHHVRW